MTSNEIRVVIVDNRAATRRGLIALFAFESRIEVIGQAANGEEAVQLVKDKQPDLVIMDIHMPVMDGLEATRVIKSTCPKIKVLVYTMYPDHEQEAKLAGADAFLYKGSPGVNPAEIILSLFPEK